MGTGSHYVYMEGEAAPSWTRVSCAGSREAAREAVDRGNAGQSLSSEITHPRKINLSPFSWKNFREILIFPLTYNIVFAILPSRKASSYQLSERKVFWPFTALLNLLWQQASAWHSDERKEEPMKTCRLMKTVLGIGITTLALSVLSVFAFAAELPEQALGHANPRVQEVMTIQEAVTPDLMSMPDVLGTAVGQDEKGELTILVYVNLEGKNPAASARNIPRSLRGKSITVEFTEPFRALVKPVPVPKVSHTAKQTPPIQLGTSGGWGYDLANGYCCGGTLGSLVQIGGIQYILSNYHVFESDIVAGGNERVATDGDPIIQPGLIDVSCNATSAQNIATLDKRSSLSDSNVDASIAQVVLGMVRSDGSILEIGTISPSTVAAVLNQPVKKSGRTTGLTRSKISGLNATVSVAYDDECAGEVAFTKTFTGQIIISNRGSKFIAGGDSGSLMVEDVTTNSRAVGLLFAGSSTLAVANPIDEVLSFLGASMVGQ